MKSELNVERDVNLHFENKGVSRHYFLFILLMYSLVCMTKNCFNGALADIKKGGVMSESRAGFIVAMFYIVYTPLQIVGGIVADKVSPELMIKIGLVGGAVANTVIFLNHNYYVMLITWTLNAVVQFALWPSVYKVISSQLCRSDRSSMLFLISIASTFGLLISYLVAAILPSWEYNFAVSAIILLVLAVGMHFYDGHVSRYAIRDYAPSVSNPVEAEKHTSIIKLFMVSGFFFMLITVLIRAVVSQGVQTLSPVMLVTTFDAEPWVSNLINTLIIICGIIGALLVKFILYPRIIKDETVGILIMMCILLGLCGLLYAVSSTMLPTVITLCLMSVVANVPTILNSYFNAGFAKYGKNGTAAGVSNSAAALGYVVASYVILSISESYDWDTVKLVWIGMLAFSVITMIPVVILSRRFKRKSEKQ